MAQQLIATIYGSNQSDWNKPLGVTMGFPTQSITIKELSPAVSYSGVACNSIIYLNSSGLEVNPTEFYTSTTASTLITNANA